MALQVEQSLVSIAEGELARLREQYERPQQERWGWESDPSQCTPNLLPYKHGDGKQAMFLSFYSAPELAIIVLVDSALPGDLPLEQRCAVRPPPSFRGLLDQIYDLCEETWDDPPAGEYRLDELRRSQKECGEMHDTDLDDLSSLWSVVIEGRSTWADA